MRELLANGIDVNALNGNDSTLLMWAAGHSKDAPEKDGLATVALVLERGAKVDAMDNRGRTALMTAAELGHAAIVKQLLAAGAQRSARDREGKSALDLADGETVKAALAGG